MQENIPSQTRRGLDKSPTVLVGEKQQQQLRKNMGILKPSLAFVETKKKPEPENYDTCERYGF